ncbi:MAG: hypothetical protein HQL50_02690 [Magnetococcales bacterium]|nr:hypothetical protein [Magnetococcales bacterium]
MKHGLIAVSMWVMMLVPSIAWSTGAERAQQGVIAAGAGHFALAIRWFSQALESNDLDPVDRLVVLNNRAVALKSLGRYQASIDDLDMLLRQEPNNAKARYNRGTVYFIIGRYNDAAWDFAEFVRLRPERSSPYPYLWLVLARMRAGLEWRELLEEKNEYLKQFDWPYPIVAFHLGDLDSEGVLKEADRVLVEDRFGRKVDALFHLAHASWNNGDVADSKRFLKELVSLGRRSHMSEVIAARESLKRLSVGVATSEMIEHKEIKSAGKKMEENSRHYDLLQSLFDGLLLRSSSERAVH